MFFFFNDTATTEIYTLSLHDALPICPQQVCIAGTVTSYPAFSKSLSAANPIEGRMRSTRQVTNRPTRMKIQEKRSEEHTSELQSRPHLVCRLLLEKKRTHVDHHQPAT